MTVGVSRVTDMASLFNQIYEDAVFALHEQTLGTRLVRTFTDGQGDQVRYLSEYPTITPVAVAETEDFAAPTQFTKTQLASLTPGEIMSQVILTDRRTMTDPQSARQDAAIEMAAGISEKIDTDILGNFNALTGGTVGAGSSSLLWGHLFAAQSILRANKVPRPYYAVLHPYGYHDLAGVAAVSATVTNAPMFQDEVMRAWYVGSVAGLDIFISANVETSGGTAAYGAVFNPSAIAFDLRKDVTMEPERDASKRAWELNISAMYATGVWRPTWGVQVVHDITTPTA